MILLAAEVLAVVLVVVFTVFGLLDAAVDRSLMRVAGQAVANAAAVREAATQTAWMYAGSMAFMVVGRFAATLGRPRNIGVHFVMPATALLTGLGLALHWGYADHAWGRFLYAPGFAEGILWGGLVAALVMALPWDPALWAERARVLLAAAAVLALVALYFFGEAPAGTGVRINLFGFQPIEGVKLAFVAFLAAVLGRRAEQLRYQRVRRARIQVPRPKLLLPAIAVLIALFGGLVAVRDLGPTLILALVFLAFYYVVTRSWVELLLAALVVPLVIAYLNLQRPGLLPDRVITRLEMWLDPWLNGYPGGDQLAASLWAFAAGGFSGQGWGRAEIRHLPTGHTDLILAHLGEVAGLLGIVLYLLGLFALVFQGLWIAGRNRTPERMLLAFGLAGLLFAQWLVIYGGAAGLLPLTGVVAPLLSYGKTSMLTFLVVVALLVRLAVSGRPRAELDELFQLRAGITWTAAAALALGLAALLAGANLMLFQHSAISARGVLAMGRDETVFLRYDPRLRAIANAIRRGEIHDRQGTALAGTRPDGSRHYPLGSAMGTLLGPVLPGVTPPAWAVEGLLDARLRGLAPDDEELSAWIEKTPGGRDRILFTVATHDYRESDLQQARLLQKPGTELLFTRLRRIDYRALLPLAQRRGEARRAAIAALVNDVAARTVQLTIDARLQQAAAGILGEVVPRYADGRLRSKAGAVVLLDVDSGQVLARAQWPDYDPGRPSTWKPELDANDRRFLGSYGPWRDKTGVGGLYQAGSIFKVFTAMAWARTGMATRGAGCGSRGTRIFECKDRDEKGPSFTQPGWEEPIHDSHAANDGDVEMAKGLQVSCNVFFAQVGLHLGPAPFEQLAADGLEVDNRRTLSPGAAGSRHLASTAFGQGAARMHAMEAARMVAAVGSGGVYRKCPPSMLLGAPCEERRLVDPPSLLEPILSGMRLVIESGTGRRFRSIPGVRVYGKTGTATDVGRRDEVPYGFRRGAPYREHSWFVALAEPDGHPSCDPTTPGRLAVAAVVPRGGDGSGAALEIAQRLLAAAREFGYLGTN